MIINGNQFANSIQGTAQADIINGGAGNDELLGGAGADTFVFGHSGAKHADQLLDYQPGVDRIAIDAAAFNLTAGQAFSYVEGTKATTALPTFIRQGSAGTAQRILFDPDGTGPMKAGMICHFNPFAGATTAADFAIL